MAILDIAKELGLSKTTVSRAISGNGRVSPETRRRVLEYIARTGYTPNASAQNLATTKTHNIAYSMPLVLVSAGASFFFECLYGVTTVASQELYDVVVVGHTIEQISRIIKSRKVDGLVLSSNMVEDSELEEIAGVGIPIILTGSTNVKNVIQLSYDERAAFRDLTLRLLNRWSDPFGLILTSSEYRVNKTRAAGFTDACTSRGIHTPTLVWNANTEDDVYQAFVNLYQQGVRNFICGDDLICANLLHAIEGGGRYPGRYRQSFENRNIRTAAFHSSHYLRTFHPEVPVVEMDPVKLGIYACRMLIRKLQNQDVPRSTLLEYSIRM